MDDGKRMRLTEYKLPRGRHRLSREEVGSNQRWRLLGGCSEVLYSGGYAAATVSRVAEAAAVSKADFYRYFKNLNECILATYEMAAAGALAAAQEGCDLAADSDSALAAAITSLLEFLASEPALTALLSDAALDDVPGLIDLRSSFAAALAALLAGARGEAEARDSSRPSVALHLVRGARSWLASRVGADQIAALPDSAPELTRLLTLESR
jgi:AcrR family transcriptional regulator